MPTPEEMRELSEAGKAAARKRQNAEARREAAARKKKKEGIMALKDGIIRSYEYAMGECAKKFGATDLRHRVLVIEKYGDRKLYEPMLDKVVEYFIDQGFKASYKIENQMEYYGDGAGPGEDYIYLTVDWSPDARP